MLNDADVQGLLGTADAVVALDAAFADLAIGQAEVLARQRIDCGSVKLSTMGAVWPQARFAAIKSYLTVNGQFSFSTTAWDTATNQVLFTLNGDELTRLRTPALACLVAARTVTPGGVLALFGAGQQGRAHAEALQTHVGFREIRVVDTADVSAWCGQASAAWHCPVRQTSAKDAVGGADLVVTTTRSKTPVFDGADLGSRATVIAMGTSLPTGRELDDATLRRADRVLVEWLPQSLIEAGEVVLGMASGALQPERITDLPALYRAGTPWRQRSDGILVFKSVGIGLSDAAVARALWQRCTPARAVRALASA